MGGSEKVQNYADIIYEWPLRYFTLRILDKNPLQILLNLLNISSLFVIPSVNLSQWTIYSATSFLESCRKVVQEKSFKKSGSRNLVREKWLTRKRGGFVL